MKKFAKQLQEEIQEKDRLMNVADRLAPPQNGDSIHIHTLFFAHPKAPSQQVDKPVASPSH